MNPILVLGAARSGTTAITRGIAAAAEYTVIDVSARLGLLHRLTQTARIYANAQATVSPEQPAPAELSAAVLAALIGDLCAGPTGGDPPSRQAEVLYAADVQTDCPNLQAAQIVLQQRPNAQAVVVWRHGVDFVNSRLRAFPHLIFASHCLTWSAAMAEMHRLSHSFESRVLVIEHGELLASPASVAAKLRRFLDLGTAGENSISRTFAASKPGRTAAHLDRPVLDPAKAGWAMPEIAMFRTLCGEASRQAGYQIDFDAAERMRPLDLAAELLDRGRSVGGLTISLPEERNNAPVVANTGTAEPAGAGLHLGPLSAGRRARLRLSMFVDESDADAELRCEVVESLSRRPIFGRTIPLHSKKETVVDETMPAHDGLLDFSFSQTPVAGHCRFRVSLREATLSRV